MELDVTKTEPYYVKVGDGYGVKTQGVCSGLEVMVQEFPITQIFFLFTLEGVEVVLGMEWLRSLGDIHANFDKLT